MDVKNPAIYCTGIAAAAAASAFAVFADDVAAVAVEVVTIVPAYRQGSNLPNLVEGSRKYFDPW